MGDIRRTYKNWDEKNDGKRRLEELILKITMYGCEVYDLFRLCVLEHSSGMLRC